MNGSLEAIFVEQDVRGALISGRGPAGDTDADGTIHGHHAATGVRPRFLGELETQGIKFPGIYFDPSKPLG